MGHLRSLFSRNGNSDEFPQHMFIWRTRKFSCSCHQIPALSISLMLSHSALLVSSRRVRLPPVNPSDEEEDLDQPPTRASTRMTRYTVDVPKAAVAGLVGEMAERLDDIQDEIDRCKPVSQAWSAIGDIYIGCKGGQIIKVCTESKNW